MVSHKVLVAIILLNVYIGVQSVFYLFGGVILTVLFAMAFLNGPRLLDWASSPPHLQFNKYVLTGYRPISSVQDCIRSLFYLHNELGNIYTHGKYKNICMKCLVSRWGFCSRCDFEYHPPAAQILYRYWTCWRMPDFELKPGQFSFMKAHMT